MSDAVSINEAAVKRTGRWIRSNLVRIRRARLQYGSSGLPDDQRATLCADLKAVRNDLVQLIAACAIKAADDQQLSRLLDVARQVLDDCNEILNLIV